ncbi:MAG: SulP family inorganic anion transporter [Candidatus Nanopelagicales bacterium]
MPAPTSPLWPRPQPNWARLRRYPGGALRPDLFSGLSVAAYLIPQVMAYATLAGVSPVAGLWGCLLPMTIYAFAGTSRLLSMGPESTTAIMTAASLASLAGGDPVRYAALTSLAAVLVGVICLAAGLFRVGFIAEWLSRPVLIGYLAGVAVIMIAGQLGKLLGVPVAAERPLAQVIEAAGKVGTANPTTLALSSAVLLLLMLGAWRAPGLPWPLLAVLAATAATAGLHLTLHGVAVVGPVPGGLPSLRLPQGLQEAPALLPALAGIAVVAFTDTMLTARAFAGRDEQIDADAELRALGLGNLAAGLTGAFPISSSSSRTAIASLGRARTPAYGLVTVASVAMVLLLGGQVLADFPIAALGALVVYAAFRIVEWSQFRWLWHFRRSEFWLGIAACLAVLLLDILSGIAVAVALSGVAMLARVARPHAASLGLVPGLAGMHDLSDYETGREIPGLVVFRYDSPLFFANAEDFRTRVLSAVATHLDGRVPVRVVLLNCESITDIDSTAVTALTAVLGELRERDVELHLARVHFETAELLDRAGLLDQIGAAQVFPTLPTAVAAFRERFAA